MGQYCTLQDRVITRDTSIAGYDWALPNGKFQPAFCLTSRFCGIGGLAGDMRSTESDVSFVGNWTLISAFSDTRSHRPIEFSNMRRIFTRLFACSSTALFRWGQLISRRA